MHEIHRKWIEALRSGKYKQGSGVYCRYHDGEPHYCCLGVLAKVAGYNYEVFENGEVQWEGAPTKRYVVDDYLEKMKLDSVMGAPKQGTDTAICPSLWSLNDNDKWTFNQIADHLEQNIDKYATPELTNA